MPFEPFILCAVKTKEMANKYADLALFLCSFHCQNTIFLAALTSIVGSLDITKLSVTLHTLVTQLALVTQRHLVIFWSLEPPWGCTTTEMERFVRTPAHVNTLTGLTFT